MTRYLNVLRNAIYLFTWGGWQSALLLYLYSKKSNALGKKLHVVIMLGGLGDIVAMDPCVRSVVEPNSFVVALIRPSYSKAIDFHPMFDARIRVDAYLQAILLKKIFKSAKWTNPHIDGHVCNMFRVPWPNKNPGGLNTENYFSNQRSLADVYSLVVTGSPSFSVPHVYPDPQFNVENFLSKHFSHSKPFIGVHFQATEKSRSYPKLKARYVIEKLLSLYDINVIEFGLNSLLEPSDRVLLIKDTLSIPAQFSVLRSASFFLGVESGFAHVAKALGVENLTLLGQYREFFNYSPWPKEQKGDVLRGVSLAADILEDSIIEKMENAFLIKRML